MENNPGNQDQNNPNTTNAGEVVTENLNTNESEESTFVINEQTIMASLSYLSILVLIPLLTKKDDPFVKYHIKQGLVLLAPELIIYVVSGVFLFMWPIWSILNLGFLCLTIVGIIHALRKEEKPLPLIGQFSDKITL
jgi:uncharacterized membrane protein